MDSVQSNHPFEQKYLIYIKFAFSTFIYVCDHKTSFVLDLVSWLSYDSPSIIRNLGKFLKNKEVYEKMLEFARKLTNNQDCMAAMCPKFTCAVLKPCICGIKA